MRRFVVAFLCGVLLAGAALAEAPAGLLYHAEPSFYLDSFLPLEDGGVLLCGGRGGPAVAVCLKADGTVRWRIEDEPLEAGAEDVLLYVVHGQLADGRVLMSMVPYQGFASRRWLFVEPGTGTTEEAVALEGLEAAQTLWVLPDGYLAVLARWHMELKIWITSDVVKLDESGREVWRIPEKTTLIAGNYDGVLEGPVGGLYLYGVRRYVQGSERFAFVWELDESGRIVKSWEEQLLSGSRRIYAVPDEAGNMQIAWAWGIWTGEDTLRKLRLVEFLDDASLYRDRDTDGIMVGLARMGDRLVASMQFSVEAHGLLLLDESGYEVGRYMPCGPDGSNGVFPKLATGPDEKIYVAIDLITGELGGEWARKGLLVGPISEGLFETEDDR